MRVLKIVAEGATTSFRYPHFMQQIHPSFQMPPPATIYGHICSALGEWFDPTDVRFAYHFTYEGRVKDLEHIIILAPATGNLPGTRIAKVVEGNVTPFERDLLFRPRLTLYVNRPEWQSAFGSPRYPVALGRSQDLFTYTHVGTVELEEASHAYFEHSLLPHAMALEIAQGVTVLMPRHLDHSRGRSPSFERYLVVQDRVHLPNESGFRFGNPPVDRYWVDPTTPEDKGSHLGLALHSFTGD